MEVSRILAISKPASKCRKNTFGLWLTSLILAVYLIQSVRGRDAESCPANCICKWMGGKRRADCTNGGFQAVPPGLSPELQVLDLSGSNVSRLSDDIFRNAGLLNLQRIFIKNSQIETVDPRAFRDLLLLVSLDLSGNKIQTLDMETFDQTPSLRELQLNNNPLTKLTGNGFPPLLQISKLGLKNCYLSELHMNTFDKLANLEYLDLSENRFRTLSKDLFLPLRNLKSLGLRDNPWHCDCELQDFRDWAHSNQLLEAGTKCVDNTELSDLNTSHLTCGPQILSLEVIGDVAGLGKEIRLECLVKANPPADVQWLRDNSSLTNATEGYVLQVSGEAERWVNLTMKHEDAGIYTCVGQNKDGRVEKNVTLSAVNKAVGGLGSQPLPWVLLGVPLTPGSSWSFSWSPASEKVKQMQLELKA